MFVFVVFLFSFFSYITIVGEPPRYLSFYISVSPTYSPTSMPTYLGVLLHQAFPFNNWLMMEYPRRSPCLDGCFNYLPTYRGTEFIGFMFAFMNYAPVPPSLFCWEPSFSSCTAQAVTSSSIPLSSIGEYKRSQNGGPCIAHCCLVALTKLQVGSLSMRRYFLEPGVSISIYSCLFGDAAWSQMDAVPSLYGPFTFTTGENAGSSPAWLHGEAPKCRALSITTGCLLSGTLLNWNHSLVSLLSPRLPAG